MDNDLVKQTIEAMAVAIAAVNNTPVNNAHRRDARAAFHAQNGIVRVVPPEATEDMDGAIEGIDGEEDVSLRLSKEIYAAMTAAGDLTRRS